MVNLSKIIKSKLFLASLATVGLVSGLLSNASATNVGINAEICGANADAVVQINYENNETVFFSPISLNFLTDWVHSITTTRFGTTLGSSTLTFAEGETASQSIDLNVGANPLVLTINGGCPSHDVLQNLNINYNPNGVSVNPLTTSNSSPELTGKLGKNNYTLRVTINGRTYDATNNGDGTWLLPEGTINPPLANGSYDVRMQLYNGGTQINDVSEPGILIIDQASPALTFNKVVSNNSSPQLTGTVNNDEVDVTVEINGQIYTATNNGDGTWTLPADTISPALADGTYDVIVTATDPLAGNTVVANITSANGVVIDTIAPSVTLNETETTDNQPQLTGTVDDPTAVVTVEINGETYTATNNGDGTWTLPSDMIDPPLVSGEYDIVVIASDAAGNFTRIEIAFKVDVPFVLPPLTGYFRVDRTNIPAWLVYLALVGVAFILIPLLLERRQKDSEK